MRLMSDSGHYARAKGSLDPQLIIELFVGVRAPIPGILSFIVYPGLTCRILVGDQGLHRSAATSFATGISRNRC